VEREEGVQVTIDDSINSVAFEFFWYEWNYPYAWHRFHLLFEGEIVAVFDMDTGTILLEKAGEREHGLVERSSRLRSCLAQSSIDLEALRPILRMFPNGHYALNVIDIEEPFLVDPNSVRDSFEEREQGRDANSKPLRRALETTVTPNLLIPTRRLDTCDARVIWDYENQLRSGDRPAILLFKEPYRYSIIQSYRGAPLPGPRKSWNTQAYRPISVSTETTSISQDATTTFSTDIIGRLHITIAASLCGAYRSRAFNSQTSRTR